MSYATSRMGRIQQQDPSRIRRNAMTPPDWACVPYAPGQYGIMGLGLGLWPIGPYMAVFMGFFYFADVDLAQVTWLGIKSAPHFVGLAVAFISAIITSWRWCRYATKLWEATHEHA